MDMALLFFGIFLLSFFILLVLGAPLIYFMKRDQRWQGADDRTPETWYHPPRSIP